MIKTSRQLKDLIRNMARRKSADPQVLLRNYAMERFLERISLSQYRHNFILKGGMLVAALVGLESRSTMDIDTTVKGTTIHVDAVKEIVEQIIHVNVEDGASFRVKSISEIMQEADYPGVRVNLDCLFDGAIIPLKIDISTGDTITPKEILYSYKLMFEERTIDILAYNLETVVAEKLETVLARATANTRMRDFYDLHILLSLYERQIDRSILNKALFATAEKRGSQSIMVEAERILTSVHNNQEMQRFWNKYCTQFSYASDLSWNTVVRSVRETACCAGLAVKRPSVLELLKEMKAVSSKEKPVNNREAER